MAENEYIRFDWAMVRMLRQKSNFTILEGLLTTLLGMEIKIKQELEDLCLRYLDPEGYQNLIESATCLPSL